MSAILQIAGRAISVRSEMELARRRMVRGRLASGLSDAKDYYTMRNWVLPGKIWDRAQIVQLRSRREHEALAFVGLPTMT